MLEMHRLKYEREKRKKKMNSTLLVFKVWKPENFRKFFAKEEEEEEEEIQRDSKFVKEYVEKLFVKVVSIVSSLFNVNQGISFIDSSSLVKKTIGRIITFRKT